MQEFAQLVAEENLPHLPGQVVGMVHTLVFQANIGDRFIPEPVMQFTLILSSSPQDPASRRALCFARAVIAGGHQLQRIFFYQDAVHLASRLLVVPQDEQNLAAQWQEFIRENQLDAVVCIAAGLRRGILDQAEAQRYKKNADNLAVGFELSGLGQLHAAMQDADRVVHFKGDA